jgi:anti-anti-sigma regulatory factor
MLHTHLEMIEDQAVVTLTGYAGPESASRLNQVIAGTAQLPVRRMTFELGRLTALPSASLRNLLMVHQLQGRDLEIVFAGANPAVAETIRLSGFVGDAT